MFLRFAVQSLNKPFFSMLPNYELKKFTKNGPLKISSSFKTLVFVVIRSLSRSFVQKLNLKKILTQVDPVFLFLGPYKINHKIGHFWPFCFTIGLTNLPKTAIESLKRDHFAFLELAFPPLFKSLSIFNVRFLSLFKPF